MLNGVAFLTNITGQLYNDHYGSTIMSEYAYTILLHCDASI